MMDRRSITLTAVLLLPFWFLALPSGAAGTVLTSDTMWKGEVIVSEDILVPAGVTLTIAAGTVIKVAASESTRTDPEYLSPLTEITVRGRLNAAGTHESPVLFVSGGEGRPETWAGIFVDGGTATLQSCRIRHAETGVYAIQASVVISDSLLADNRYGLIAQGEKTRIGIQDSTVADNDYGMFSFGDAQVNTGAGVILKNRKKDLFSRSPKEDRAAQDHRAEERNLSRRYADAVLPGDTIWQGRIVVEGSVRVPEGSRLIILPGALVEFKRRDTNGDDLGENGLLVQGVLIAKGEPKNPIVFRSGEKNKRMGDWDGINIMNSDGAQNLLEYCRIEDAYRGIHFHFSNVAIKDSVITNTYRAVQFQESTADISRNMITGNKSAVQARDSEITLRDNTVFHNFSGINFFRSTFQADGNAIVANMREGLRVREGIATVERNLLAGNRQGLVVADSLYGKFSNNLIVANLETGVSLKNTDSVDVSGNFIQANGLNGIAIQGSAAGIRGNVISRNGERGIGIAGFQGVIAGNSIVDNGLYALGVEGRSDVSAPQNWWGGADLRKAIYDKGNDPSRGRVVHEQDSSVPLLFSWPVRNVPIDIVWHGAVAIPGPVTVLPDAVLTVAPGTRVSFAAGAGLKVNGKIIARGMPDARISFFGTSGKAESWDEIFLDHAVGSVFSHCDVQRATWGIHSHFTNLAVNDCTFRKNYGGIRFQSGPIEVRRSLFEENSIAIRAFRGSAVIADNVLTGNETGIFVREKGGGLTITGNNIFSNSDYDIRLGDFNDEDVEARANWWGGANSIPKIFDARMEPGIGTVRYEPFQREPYATGAHGGR